jgi:hypothetical protein
MGSRDPILLFLCEYIFGNRYPAPRRRDSGRGASFLTVFAASCSFCAAKTPRRSAVTATACAASATSGLAFFASSRSASSASAKSTAFPSSFASPLVPLSMSSVATCCGFEKSFAPIFAVRCGIAERWATSAPTSACSPTAFCTAVLTAVFSVANSSSTLA